MTQLKDGGRQPGNREERSLSASTVIARWQGNGEPCKSRGLRTVLWAAGGEIPPADPATWNPLIGYARVSTEDQATFSQLDDLRAAGCAVIFEEKASGANRARPELARAVARVGRGDILVVARIDESMQNPGALG